MQFDADTVGAASVAADAEMCMMAADTLEKLGIKRGDYVIKVNNRKVLDGVMEAIGLGGDLTLKFRSGSIEQSRLALERGERSPIFNFPGEDTFPDETMSFGYWRDAVGSSEVGAKGVDELEEIATLCRAANYGGGRIIFDSSVVRGLEYYTGPVFEAELTFEIDGDDGKPVRFGSIGGGGRYDGLVGRFRAENVPATGFSIGVSRLFSALKAVSSPIVATNMPTNAAPSAPSSRARTSAIIKKARR